MREGYREQGGNKKEGTKKGGKNTPDGHACGAVRDTMTASVFNDPLYVRV
jgi:hypothetical protein